ncbi:alkaline shock response membrane anchor protein AmaP, partial [Streptomyces nigra]
VSSAPSGPRTLVPGSRLSFTEGALAHARNSAGLASLPAEVRLRGVKHGAERVS